MSSGHFARIEIIQSLPSGELQTGRRLREEVEPLIVSLDYPITVRLTDVAGGQQFLAKLEELAQSTGALGIPLLHLECHGTDDKRGLAFADSSWLTWDDIKPALTELNRATECNLFVTLAMCYGAYLGDIVKIQDRAPCMAYVGPKDEVFAHELATSFGAFYRELLVSLDGGRALRTLRSPDGQPAPYFFLHAEGLFRAAYQRYREMHRGDQALRQRATALQAKLRELGKVPLPSVDELVAIYPASERRSIAEMLRHFFMVDLFPQNASRFPTLVEELQV